MYHLDEMTGTGRTNPLAARGTVRCFCRNTLQDRLHLRPGTFRASGHDRRAVQRSFLSTGNSGSHKTEAFLFGQCHTPVGVLIIGITTVNQDIPSDKWGNSCSISSSTALPARTIIIILRGVVMEVTNSAMSV